jgi:tRNA threonylcarbamoyladenosine biosynthesis protein TsaE
MILADPAATDAAGRGLGAALRAGDVVLLRGALGAGKTAFARGVLRGLGFAGDVASPTFPIVVAYEPPQLRLPVWHADLYRIDHPEEIEELGLDEVLATGALLIEWPERLGRPWPGALELEIVAHGPGRALTAGVPPAWGDRWPPR